MAGFIGTPQMNFFDAKLVKDGSKYSVELGAMKVALSDAKQKALAAKNVSSQDITLGVRPSHVVLSSDAANSIEATVDVSEMMGSELHLHVAVQDGIDVVLRVPTTDLPKEWKAGIPFGTQVHFTFREDLIHLFDPASTNNLIPFISQAARTEEQDLAQKRV